jgi:GNAT superfamily N-acetyltransferase
MALEMTAIRPDQVDGVGQMVYEAFHDIATRHNFEPAFPDAGLATIIVRLLVQTEGYGTYLLSDAGKPVACNFGDERDEIVGVGPVAVAVQQQGNGYGRQVMEAMLKRAQEAGFRSVRLVQVAYNMQSFALYHNLGFNATGMLANLRGRPGDGESPVDSVREYTPADLDACDELHRDVLGVGRRHDIELMANFAPPIVVERDGQIAGYLTRFPGEETFVTHGVARDERALRDALIGIARATTGEVHVLLPVSYAGTVRWAMGQGFRLLELDSYMV